MDMHTTFSSWIVAYADPFQIHNGVVDCCDSRWTSNMLFPVDTKDRAGLVFVPKCHTDSK